jgi:hypothetical protein
MKAKASGGKIEEAAEKASARRRKAAIMKNGVSKMA